MKDALNRLRNMETLPTPTTALHETRVPEQGVMADFKIDLREHRAEMVPHAQTVVGGHHLVSHTQQDIVTQQLKGLPNLGEVNPNTISRDKAQALRKNIATRSVRR